MAELNKKQIAQMEEEYLRLQNIELGFKKKTAPANKLLFAIGARAGVYDNPATLRDILKKLDDIMLTVAKSGAVRGKRMAAKTIENFFEKSVRKERTLSIIQKIERIGKNDSKKRLALYREQIRAEKARLIDEIAVAKKRLVAAGLTGKEVSKELVKRAIEGRGPIKDFAKRIETLESNILRREESQVEINEYRKIAGPDEDWQWIAVSVNPCPDCQIRAGAVLSFSEWEDEGLPGDGSTICRESCMCKLVPLSISEDLFPDVKQFDWDKNTGVLTERSSMKVFRKAEAA